MPTYEDLIEMGFYLTDEEVMEDLFETDEMNEEEFQALIDAANEALIFEKEPIEIDCKEITDLDEIREMFDVNAK